MRICPRCKFVDPPEWRHSKHSYWIDFTETENSEKLHPSLAKQLSPGQIVEDELFYYRMMKNGRYVERKAKIDYGEQFHIPMEKAKHKVRDQRKSWNRIVPTQKKLVNIEP